MTIQQAVLSDKKTDSARRSLSWLGCLLALLEAGVAARSKLGLELLDPASRVNKLQLSREEWMTHITDVELDLRHRTPGGEAVATATFHNGVNVLRVNAFFHRPARLLDF